MEKKMHTYIFEYNSNIDGYGEITFCAENVNEARKLFDDWCVTDLKLEESIVPTSVKEVYNPDDAEYYGDSYARFGR